ncbi:MAG: type II toxin-antitoxin system VapC family toxin [Bryobacterales bacterium]|nr:type II toxin-antitoxin system VapC family toxin [Bryobacterales bacterium]
MILDTNALSALADGDEGLGSIIAQGQVLAIPVIVLGEFRFGIAYSRDHARYRTWLEDMVRSCRVLPIDNRTAEFYAGVRSDLKKFGRPIPQNDLWIAALARQHQMPMISRDRHFDAVPELVRINW